MDRAQGSSFIAFTFALLWKKGWRTKSIYLSIYSCRSPYSKRYRDDLTVARDGVVDGIGPLAWNIENGTAFSSGIIFCFYAGQSIAPLRKFFVIYQPFCDRPPPCYAWLTDAPYLSSHLLWFPRCSVPFFHPSFLSFFFSPPLFFSTGNIFARSKISPRFSTAQAFPYRQSSNDLGAVPLIATTANIYIYISTIRLDVFSSLLRGKKWLKKPLVTSDKPSKKGVHKY